MALLSEGHASGLVSPRERLVDYVAEHGDLKELSLAERRDATVNLINVAVACYGVAPVEVIFRGKYGLAYLSPRPDQDARIEVGSAAFTDEFIDRAVEVVLHEVRHAIQDAPRAPHLDEEIDVDNKAAQRTAIVTNVLQLVGVASACVAMAAALVLGILNIRTTGLACFGATAVGAAIWALGYRMYWTAPHERDARRFAAEVVAAARQRQVDRTGIAA